MDLWIHRISGNSYREHGQSLALCGFKVGLLYLPLSERGAEVLHGYRYWVQAGDQISGDWTLVKLVGKDAEGSHSWYEWCEQVRSFCLSRFRAGFYRRLDQNVENARVGIDPKLITLGEQQGLHR